jgi:hypothetical protein
MHQLKDLARWERAADKRSGQQERQQRFFVAGCVVVCDIFYSFLVYMLGNCYIFGGRGKKGTSFCRNIVPAKRNSWKVNLEKKGKWKGIPFFCRNLEVISQDS